MFNTLAKLFQTRKARPAQRKPKTAQLRVEALEDRLVPAFVAPAHTISATMAGELQRGESYLSVGKFEDAFSSLQIVERQAYDRHDASTELRLADDYRLLGGATLGLKDFRHDCFALEKQAYSNAIGSAEFWTFYGGERDSGDYRAYGIGELGLCEQAYDDLLMGMPAGSADSMKVIQSGATDLLAKANHEWLIDGQGGWHGVIAGEWVTDDGHSIFIRDREVTVHSPTTNSYSTMSAVTPDGTAQEGGAWNATPVTFTLDCDSLVDDGQFYTHTFTFDPQNSGRMQVQDSAGHTFEVYRSWDNIRSVSTPWSSDPMTNRLVDFMNKSSPADAARECWRSEGGLNVYTRNQVIGALEIVGGTEAAQIVLNFPTPQVRADTLTGILAQPDWSFAAGDIAWNLGTWTQTMEVLNNMDAKSVAKLAWNYTGWDRTIDMLSHMTNQRAGEVLLNFKDLSSGGWNAVKNTFIMMQRRDAQWPSQVLNTMASYQVAQVLLNSYANDPASQARLLNGMNTRSAALAVWALPTWKQTTDVLAQMSNARAAQMLVNFNTWENVKNTLYEMYKVNHQWPYLVLREFAPGDLSRLIINQYYDNPNNVLSGLTPSQVSRVLINFAPAYRVVVLNGMTAQRAANVLINLDPSVIGDLLNRMTAARRQAVKQALGW